MHQLNPHGRQADEIGIHCDIVAHRIATVCRKFS
jgi:hypothetical protein